MKPVEYVQTWHRWHYFEIGAKILVDRYEIKKFFIQYYSSRKNSQISTLVILAICNQDVIIMRKIFVFTQKSKIYQKTVVVE